MMLAALALIASVNPYPVTTVFDGWPPPRFQIMPDKSVHILFGRVAINAECGHPQPFEVIEACSEPDEKLLIMPDPCKFPATDNYARLLCHEVAHLAGWPGSHGP